MASGGVLGSGSIPFFGCVVLLIAMILHVLAFALPQWAKDNEGTFGLWTTNRDYCGGKNPKSVECQRFNDHWSDTDRFRASQALECLTIIFWAFPLIIIPVYLYIALGLHYRIMLGLMACLTLLGAVCNIIGVIIFGVEIEDSSELSVRWCLPVCAAGGCVGFLAFFAYFVAALSRPNFNQDQHYLSGFYVDPYKNRMYVVESTEPPVDMEAVQSNGGTVSPGQVNPIYS